MKASVNNGAQQPLAQVPGDLASLPEGDQRLLHRVRGCIVVAEDSPRGRLHHRQVGLDLLLEARQADGLSVITDSGTTSPLLAHGLHST